MHPESTTVLVLGASGLLGNAVSRVFATRPGLRVFCTLRNPAIARRLRNTNKSLQVIDAVNADRPADLGAVFEQVRPNVVVNYIGLTKHVDAASQTDLAFRINAVLPHSIAALSAMYDARMIHVSTDCVFTGSKGMYDESNPPDATDTYGRSKAAGEVCYRHTLTIRTSIIGHEIGTSRGLLEWFLQQRQCLGYCRPVFSGFPAVTLARIIRDWVVPNKTLSGVYHVASSPIDKCSLLRRIAAAYSMSTSITEDYSVAIDRSLNGSRFTRATGFLAPDWDAMIAEMRSDWRANSSLFARPDYDS